MPGLFFTNAWMLLGLSALSIPVIIHLLLRRKKKRFRFSTVQFFLRQDEQASQRRKLRNFLLLALRLLICALLVLAFARPYLENTAGAGPAGRQRRALIVLDRSLSMRANALGGAVWTRAREAAQNIISQLKPSDRAALVSAGTRAEVVSEWAPALVVSQRLKDLQPTFGSASLAEALSQSARLLSIGDRDLPTTVYVISDFQRSGCENLASSPLPPQTEVKPIKIGDLVTPNLAITDLQIADEEFAGPRATVTSFSDQDASDLKLEWLVDGNLVSTRSLGLAAGASTNLELALPRLKPGWHDIAVELRVRDALPIDNRRFAALVVPEPTRVLVVETRQGKHTFEEESFFVRTALNPGGGDGSSPAPPPAVSSGDKLSPPLEERGLFSRFVCEKVAADELASRLAASKGRTACDLVILAGLKQIPSALGQALLTHLNAGGGLMMFASDELSVNRYNAEFKGVLPAQLDSLERRAETESPWRFGVYETNSVFGVFAAPESGDLSLPRFTGRYSLQPGPGSAVLARFDDGAPLILARSVGRGRVLLVNSSMDTAWNDWPKHKTFLPWLHAAAEYLTSLPNQSPAPKPTSFIAGTAGDLDLGSALAKASLKLRSHDGKEVPVTADERGELRDISLSEPGAYSVRDSAGNELRRVAVNVPSRESDLAALSAPDFQQQIARMAEERKPTLTAGLFGTGGNHRELWHVLLLGLGGLLLVEMMIANRTTA